MTSRFEEWSTLEDYVRTFAIGTMHAGAALVGSTRRFGAFFLRPATVIQVKLEFIVRLVPKLSSDIRNLNLLARAAFQAVNDFVCSSNGTTATRAGTLNEASSNDFSVRPLLRVIGLSLS